MLSLPEVLRKKKRLQWFLTIRLVKHELVYFFPFQVSDFFAKLIQRVAPKSYQQALGEVYVTGKFLENFSCDQGL
ncbi:putative L-glutamate gamma-semialdehyde dehydrogenase [Helianthus annuus]|nr:putative L-glutamate gamma-semialdehyde dehydrogenase [Helianthus annuus]